MKKQLANLLTGFRILCSIGMLFCSVYSGGFYVLYLFCGLSDMADGTVARKMHADSDFGAGLDTAADLLFTAVSLWKLLPVIQIPAWLWQWMTVIGVIKISCLIWYVITRQKIENMHTAANKITGLCLFLLPFTLRFFDLQYSAPAVCFLATFSAMQEVCSVWRDSFKRKNVR